MEQLRFDGPIDAAEELRALLARSGVDFKTEGRRFRFVFSSGGCKWQTVCDCDGERAFIYGIFPLEVKNREAALELCAKISSVVILGGCFPSEGRIIFRTSAELRELCMAQEQLLRALEYNAAVMTKFWAEMSAAATLCP